MNTKLSAFLMATVGLSVSQTPVDACTGITLKSREGTIVTARTIEWAASVMNTFYVVVPRLQTFHSFTPQGENGLEFTSQYGYVGLAVEQKEFIVEGMNEKGLSAGLFYFANYGRYQPFDEREKERCLSDFQVVSYVLGECATVDEVKDALRKVRIVNIDPRSSTVHWRFTEPSGRQLVLEIIDEELRFYENPLGVLTNSPGLEWHWTNLNNYLNLTPGTAPEHTFGPLRIPPFGGGSGLLGLPGDVTSPSRFVRATFYQITAPLQATTQETVFQAFHLLNNFDIPVGIQFSKGEAPADVPSATQFTVACDMHGQQLYYRTMYNCNIRCIDLKSIDFERTNYQYHPLDINKQQPVEKIRIE